MIDCISDKIPRVIVIVNDVAVPDNDVQIDDPGPESGKRAVASQFVFKIFQVASELFL